DPAALQLTAAVQAAGRFKLLQWISHACQHALSMISTDRRFADTGPTLGIQSGQQNAGLDLSAGYRRIVLHALQFLPALNTQWRCTVFAGRYGGAHPGQRLGDSAHGSDRKRSI